MNDLLFVHFHNGPGGSEPVAWRALTPFVTQLEGLASDAALRIFQNTIALSGPQRDQAGEARMMLAGNPRVGSIVVPFALELPVVFNVATMSAPIASNAISEYVGTLADLAALSLFVRDLIFGDRGLIARRTDQISGSPLPTAESRAIETASATYVDMVAPSIEKLMEAAERTGCEQIELQVNDNAKIKLIMSDRRRRSTLLARTPVPATSPDHPAPPGYQFSPSNPGVLVRRSEAVLKVRYQGDVLTAIVLQDIGITGTAVVALWAASAPLPLVNEQVEIRAEVVDRLQVEPLADIDPEFERATYVMRVTQARAGWR